MALTALSPARQRGARVLLYHCVTHASVRDRGEMTVPLAMFEAQLDLLAERGYRVRAADWLVAELSAGRSIAPRSVVITFDDGLAEVYRVAAPALARRSYPWAAFLLSEALDGRLGPPLVTWSTGYMTARDALDLARDPTVTLGSHGASHAPLRDLSSERLRAETAGAKARLELIFGRAVALYAYPFGVREMWSSRARRAVADAGFAGAFTSVFGGNGAGADVFLLRRTRVSWRDDRWAFGRLLDGRYDWYAGVQRMQLVFGDVVAALGGSRQRSSR